MVRLIDVVLWLEGVVITECRNVLSGLDSVLYIVTVLRGVGSWCNTLGVDSVILISS